MTTGKVTGDALTITKPVWNDIIDAKEFYKRNFAQGAAGTPTPQARNHSIVSARNSTGGALRLGEVIELDDRVLGDSYLTNDHLWFDGKKVSFSANRNTFGIMLEPVPSDSSRCGKALLLGTCLARVDFSDTSHKFAELDDGELVLKSSATEGDIRIISTPDGTGEQLVFVLIDRSGAPEETIPLYNADSSTAVAGAIARITGYNVGQSAYNIVQPSASSFSPIWVIVNDAITAGATGTGRIFKNAGMAFAYDAAEGTPAYGEMWGPKPGSWLARKRMEGLLVLKNDSDGVATGIQKWSSEVIVKLREDLDQGGSVDCQVLKWNGTKLVNSGFSLTAYDSFLNTDETIERDTKAVVRWLYGEWLIVSAYCAPDDTEEESLAARSSGMWTVDGSLYRAARSPGSFF